VEAVRSGMIFAHDPKAYTRWRARQHSGAVAGMYGGGLAGAELERVILAMAHTNPDIVAVRVV